MEPDFSLYDNFSTAVLVLDCSDRIAFKNYAFVKTFGNIKNFAKFSNYFSFDICVLDSENLLNANPLSCALSCKENYTAHALYQRNKEYHYLLTSFNDRGYRVIAFRDITDSTLYDNLEKNYERLSVKCALLEEQNKNVSNFQQKAQTQAIKIALMHRISNVIRESIDITKIINSTLKELFNLFGAIKTYYAEYNDEDFTIRSVFPSKYKNAAGQKIDFQEKTRKEIFSKNIFISPAMREYLNCETTFAAPVTRIIVPVYRLNRFLGILLIFTNKTVEAQNDILASISSQLASAIVQASLFKEISNKNEELELTLKELKETQLQLINSEKMASLGQLVAGVAHEINTPLASINSNNDMLNTLIGRLENSDAKVLRTIENINKIDKEAIKRINQIVKSLKSFVRLDESELQDADINKEIDLTLELIHHETKNRIMINKNYAKIPKIKCYPNMLNQVFMNVLINACQSIENTGEIAITTSYNNNNLIVKIKDNGSGIDESIMDKIFTAGLTTKKIGTGLGLAISQKIIEKHNGTITFNSKKGEGTEFVITVPNSLNHSA